MSNKKSSKVIYPDLSYKIVGVLFDVLNECGPGHKEKYYQNAIALALKERGINFKREVYTPVNYRGTRVGSYYFDFLIENKIILEIKVGERFLQSNIKQILTYLKIADLRLGILANFTGLDVQFKRLLNVNL